MDKILHLAKMHILSLTGKNVTLWLKKELCLDTKYLNINEVDKEKIDVISKLLPPTNIKEFDIEIKDRKGTENVAADHLSRIEKEETSDDSEVDDNFSGENLMEVNTKDDPWFADFENYLEPYLFKVCSDGWISQNHKKSVKSAQTRTRNQKSSKRAKDPKP
ncbi:hypothetical protein Tco_0222431 [Tanacetum coccineum]